MRTTFLIFGLTGDLMKKKGIPALFALWQKRLLPENFRIIGLSRKIWNKEDIAARLSESIGQEAPQEFASLFSIYTGEGENQADIANLKNEFSLDGDKLFVYLCVSPELYVQIIKNLQSSGLLSGSAALLIEKPFGQSLENAQSLQHLLLGYGLSEGQIYRIDHFLAKDTMLELSKFSHELITSIEIYLDEALGIETRGALYDEVGALRDVGQNHLLEAAAAALGDRAEALESLHDLSKEEIKTHTIRGQHEGYTAISGVAPRSQTETFFRIESRFEIGGREIPLSIEGGKRLPWRREVVLTLADGEKTIPFSSGNNEYEILFKEAFAGDRSNFVSMREVEALWRFTDPIVKEWRAGSPPLFIYPPDQPIS